MAVANAETDQDRRYVDHESWSHVSSSFPSIPKFWSLREPSATIATIVRLKFLVQLADTKDPLYAISDTLIWSIVEVGMAMIAACMMTLKPLIERIRVFAFIRSSGSRPIRDPREHRQSNPNTNISTSLNSIPDWSGRRKCQTDSSVRNLATRVGSEEEVFGLSGITLRTEFSMSESRTAV